MNRHALNTSKHYALEGEKPKHVKKYLNKSYDFCRSERYGEFLRMLGVDKTAESKAVITKPTVVLKEQNGEYLWKTTYPVLKKKHTMKFRINEPIVKRLSNESTVVTQFEIKKNEIIERQNFDDGRTVIVTRQFEDDQLIMIMEMNAIKSYRFFVAGDSKHSIFTETSRRESFIEMIRKPSTLPPPILSTSDNSEKSSPKSAEETIDENDEICL